MPDDRKRLCDYTLIRPLGAESFLASDERGRSIVIKKLNASCLLQGRLHPAIHARLQHVREIALMSVADLLAVERDGECSYLIWQYVDGRTLNECLAAAESVELKTSAIREVRLSIDALHTTGLVHGSIHGNNIIIDEHGRVHLTHVSPLLFHDPQIDQSAVNQIARRHHLELSEDSFAHQTTDHDDRTRRNRLIAAAIGLAAVGALAAVLIAKSM